MTNGLDERPSKGEIQISTWKKPFTIGKVQTKIALRFYLISKAIIKTPNDKCWQGCSDVGSQCCPQFCPSLAIRLQANQNPNVSSHHKPNGSHTICVVVPPPRPALCHRDNGTWSKGVVESFLQNWSVILYCLRKKQIWAGSGRVLRGCSMCGLNMKPQQGLQTPGSHPQRHKLGSVICEHPVRKGVKTHHAWVVWGGMGRCHTPGE